MLQKKDAIKLIKSQFTTRRNDIIQPTTKDLVNLKSTIHIILYRNKLVKFAFNKADFYTFYNKSLQFISLL